MTIFKYFFLFTVFFLTACFNPAQKNTKLIEFQKIETLKRIGIKENHINIRVNSTGCTKSNDFIVNSEIKNNHCLVTIIRIKPDLCKRATYEIDLVINWNKNSACSLNKIEILNPLSNLPTNKSPALF